MKRTTRIQLYLAALLAIATLAAPLWMPMQPALAAGQYTGALTAKAGSGTVTAQRFVKLTTWTAGALPVIDTATAVTDAVVGVCETTAAAGVMTSFAPPGTIATVDSGEVITIGDLLTAGAGGEAFVLDVDDTSTQRVAGVALTADAAGTASVKVFVSPSAAEQRLALTGAVSLTGSSAFTSGTGTVALQGDVAVAAGKDIALTAGAGYISLGGETSGALVLNPTSVGTESTTVQNSAAASAATITLPGLSGTVAVHKVTTTTVDADVLVIPVTHGIVTKTTGADAEALTLANGTPGQVLVIILGTDGNGAGTLTPATATGWATIVFDDAGERAILLYVDDSVGWIIIGISGVAAAPVTTV